MVAAVEALKTRLHSARRSPLSLALAGHAALAFAIWADDGAISDISVVSAALLLILVGLALIAWARALQATMVRGPIALDDGARFAWLLAIGSLILVFVRPPGNHIRGTTDTLDALSAAALVLVGSYAVDLFRLAPVRPALVVTRRALLFLIAVALGAVLLKVSPDPPIDVFPLHQLTAQALLDGKPIYKPGVFNVTDTFKGTYLIQSYVYLPLSAYLTTIAYALTHDIRWANLVAQLVGSVLLWIVAERCARRGRPGEGEAARPAPAIWADVLTATLLFHPRGLLVLEKAWIEPLALPFLGGFVLATFARRRIVASVCLGLLCAVKQHLVLYVPFLALTPGIGITGLVIAGGAGLATIAPYLFPSPRDFYEGAFRSIVNVPFRTDALDVPAAVWFIGVKIPSWVGFVAALVPLRWLRRVPREVGPLLLGSCLVFGLFYLLGRQAFCNYYYLLDGTSLFAAAALVAPAERLPAATPS